VNKLAIFGCVALGGFVGWAGGMAYALTQDWELGSPAALAPFVGVGVGAVAGLVVGVFVFA
jgi:hypothetical protein